MIPPSLCIRRCVLTALCFSVWITHHATAAPGDLDLTFDSDGKAFTPIGSSGDFGYSVAVQSDGKIVVAGNSSNGSNNDFALVRYNANGSLDTTFNGTGKETTAIGSSTDDARSVVVQPDGKLVVAGASFNGSDYDFALVRHNANGSLDTTFNGTGKVTTAIGIINDYGLSVVVQPDGKLVVAGESYDAYNGGSNDFALVRYNANGSLDSSFGSGGKVTTAIGSSNDHGYSVAVQPDGKLVVGGYSSNGSKDDFALVRYNANGSLDTSFNSAGPKPGTVTTAIGNGLDRGYSVVVQPDGKLVVAGESYNGSNYDFALVRYNASGSLDTSFNNAGPKPGSVTTAIGSSHDFGRSVVLQPDGKLVVAGLSVNGSNNDFALLRYTSNGTLDSSFGTGGKVTTDIGSGSALVYSMALQSDGKIVAAGYSYNGTNNDFAVVRYQGFTTTTTNQSGALSTTSFLIAPTAGQAEIYNNSGFNITSINESNIGHAGTGVLNQTGGTHTAQNIMRVGSLVGSSGTYNLSGGSASSATELDVGNYGTGRFVQSGAGTTVAAVTLYVGKELGAQGTYELGAGSLALSGAEYIGYLSTGQFVQTGGTHNVTSFLDLGVGAGAVGSYAISGAAGVSVTSNQTEVGVFGRGTFWQSGGTHNTFILWLGREAGSTGIYQMDGGALNATGEIIVGWKSVGSLLQTAGTITTPTLGIGWEVGGNGSFTLTGGSVNVSSMKVGMQGTGVCTQTGGTLQNAGITTIAETAGISGTYNVNGGSTSGATLVVAQAGTGTLNINNNGQVSFSSIQTGSGTAQIALNKGTLNGTSTSINIGAGGLNVGDGTNAATLDLGNGTHSITGGVHVKAASTLSLSSSSASSVNVDIVGNGRLSGSGSIGAITASGTSDVTPGPGAIFLNTGSLNFSGGMSYTVELLSDGGAASGALDSLRVTGTVNLGGALVVHLGYAPAIGQRFRIIDNDGTDPVNGTFASRPEGYVYTLTNTGAGGGSYKLLLSYIGGTGNDVTLTVVDGNSDLSGWTFSAGALSSAFSSGTTSYTCAAPFAASTTFLTATAASATSTLEVRVNGGSYLPYTSGTQSTAFGLAVGSGNVFDVRVTAQDGTTKSYTVTITRAATAGIGEAELAFDPGASFRVYTLASQPDGKLIAGGMFNTFGGSTRNRIARLNANDTLDTFNPDLSERPYTVVVQSDGKSLIGGLFTTVGGVSRPYLARLNADVTLDSAFNLNADNSVRCLTMQPDGKIIVGGNFTTLGGAAHNRIARLNADGTLDASFNASCDAVVESVITQADGRLVIGGNFTTVNGSTRNRMARLNADGTLDAAFDLNADAPVSCLAQQADGKVVIGGSFTTMGGTARNHIARVSAAGLLDTGFDPNANNLVYTVAVQTDGKLVISGGFTTLGIVARSYLARLNADGTLDATFSPAADNIVYSSCLQSDGKLVIGGQFASAGGAVRSSIARILNNPATQSLTVPAYNRVQWLRGGTSPETSAVTFELSTDGGTNWSSLGAGTRISGGWERTGLTLPASGQIRARARTIAGLDNASSGLVQTVAAFSGLVLPPVVTLASASGTTATTTTLNGTVNPSGGATTAQFEYGLTTSYGSTASVTLSPNNGSTAQSVSASVSGLSPVTSYHYRLTATNSAGTTSTTDGTFTTQSTLAFTYNAAGNVPVTASSFTATGGTFNALLNFAPAAGTTLMVVKNTGLGFISGAFSNLAQGQKVPLTYNGLTYNFVANYYGDTGNDLVLQWAGMGPGTLGRPELRRAHLRSTVQGYRSGLLSYGGAEDGRHGGGLG